MLSTSQYLMYAEEEHFCPHCNGRLTCCKTPFIPVGDGLGWGSEIMFVCLNNECPPYVKGWQHIEEQYGHLGSYRHMKLPGEKKGEMMVVGSSEAFTGCVLDPEQLKKDSKRYQQEKKALEALENCIEEHDLGPALQLVLDDNADLSGRKRACNLLEELDDFACIDPIRNHTFTNQEIEEKCDEMILTILQRHYKKECPYCSEIIKQQAKFCMYCKEKLSD
ncbi:MAG: zinc ribbon domain-containing protein [Thermodesulfobacteriota bacterium]